MAAGSLDDLRQGVAIHGGIHGQAAQGDQRRYRGIDGQRG
jgi:hypothetical protein